MRILDRYAVKQLIPVTVWCVCVFLLLSCMIDLFGHLDEILRYHVAMKTILEYYLQFLPLVFVKSAPFALLLSTSFVAMRLSRYQELLAMSASGTPPLRASVPFIFVGWIMTLCVFAVSEWIVPHCAATYDQMKEEVFKGGKTDELLENVALMDEAKDRKSVV